MKRSTLWLLGLLLLLCSDLTRAQAQEGGEKLRFGGGLVLDFAGHAKYDPPGPANTLRDRARVTPGLRVHLDYDVHRYVSVGALVRFGWWRNDDTDDGRNMLADIAARVSGHYDWHDFRFYGVLTLGPTFSHLNSDNRGALQNPGAGVAAAFAPGLEWWMSRHVGLFCEIFGWTGHFFRHDLEGPGGRTLIRLNQVLWQLGAVFAL